MVLTPVIAILALHVAYSDTVEADLATTAVAGNQASIQMIRRYSARVDWSSTSQGKSNSIRSEYWREGSKVRIREETIPGRILHLLYEGDVLKLMTTGTGDNAQTGEHMTISERNKRVSDANAWELSMFSLPVGLHGKPNHLISSLADAVQKGQVVGANWVTLEGRKTALLKITTVRQRARKPVDF